MYRIMLISLAAILLIMGCSSSDDTGSPSAPCICVETWISIVATAQEIQFHDIIQTEDEGYAAVGWTGPVFGNQSDFYLVRLDSDGDTLWSRSYIPGGSSFAEGVAQTSDGGFLLVGSHNGGMYAVKTNEAGVVSWQQAYGGGAPGEINGITRLPDGNYALALIFDVQFSIMVIDEAGDEIWTRFFFDGLNSSAQAVKTTTDGGLVAAGWVDEEGGARDVSVVKMDAEGALIWSRTVGAVGDHDVGMDIIETSGGEYIVCGYTAPFASSDGYAARLNADGDVLWTNAYGGGAQDRFFGVAEVGDGQFVLGGFSRSFSGGDDDVYLIGINSSGAQTWQKTYLTLLEEQGLAMKATADGGVVIGGYILQDTNALKYDGLVLKLDADGDM